MIPLSRRLKLVLIGLGILSAVTFLYAFALAIPGISGLRLVSGQPVGADFLNLWSAGRLTLLGRVSEIYQSAAFQAFEEALAGGDMGSRLWAYPPHSLLFAWAFGLTGYYIALAVWTALGLSVLGLGARRFGFDRLETAVIVLSPAAALCVYYGQTGNLAAGLMLMALAPKGPGDKVSTIAAALLTIKPQTGFLLPLIWLVERRWRRIAWTAALAAALVALSLAVFGFGAWRDYVGDTLAALSWLERTGSGPFVTMIPSVFMSVRIVSGNPDLAIWLHAGFAVAVGAVLVWRLVRVDDGIRRAALVFVATAMMTPYIHNYDLALLFCGALVVARRWQNTGLAGWAVFGLLLVIWSLPLLVVVLNWAGIPVSPLLIAPLLFLA
jgi:arabinofuranan 3-O-arabinosyltransferase